MIHTYPRALLRTGHEMKERRYAEFYGNGA